MSTRKCAWCSHEAATDKSLCISCIIKRKETSEKKHADEPKFAELIESKAGITKMIDTSKPIHSIPCIFPGTFDGFVVERFKLIRVFDTPFQLYSGGIQIGESSNAEGVIVFNDPHVIDTSTRLFIVFNRPIETDLLTNLSCLIHGNGSEYVCVFPDLINCYSVHLCGNLHTLFITDHCKATLYINGTNVLRSKMGVFNMCLIEETGEKSNILTNWQSATCYKTTQGRDALLEFDPSTPPSELYIGVTHYQTYRYQGTTKKIVEWSPYPRV